MMITVYTKPNCVQCNATYRALDAKGLRYRSVDLTRDDEAMNLGRVSYFLGTCLRDLCDGWFSSHRSLGR
ncbi:glutaredoxin family protein [Brevibacterium aurantiacum]|nr:glutaredoxin family protein [Brevibacterium aurantiacum]RCS93496.1 glutaredoxin family protein [Brevibacterium aurantiacum]